MNGLNKLLCFLRNKFCKKDTVTSIDSSNKKEAKWVKKNTLIIYHTDGFSHSYTVETTNECGKVEPWKDFYKWYFSKGTKTYTFRYDTGETTIKREDIKRFSISIVDI